MPFQLEEVTAVAITNANPRREFHGEEKVRAIDLSFALKGENTLLDTIEPGLREHHYFNKALKALQDEGPATAAELGEVIDRPAGTVAALLKHDLHSGRVRRSGSNYEINPDFDDGREEVIKKAITLLRRHGYEVKRKARNG